MTELIGKERYLLNHIDVEFEMAQFGVRLGNKRTATGWIPCSNPYNQPANTSCAFNVGNGSLRGYIIIFYGSLDGKRVAYNFFSLASDFLPSTNGDSLYSLKYYTEKIANDAPASFMKTSSQEDTCKNSQPDAVSPPETIDQIRAEVEAKTEQEKKEYSKPDSGKTGVWDHPMVLDRKLPPAPDFPLHCLPGVVQDFVEDVSIRFQCPPDMVIIPLLVSLAGVIGKDVVLRPKRKDSWGERACLWGIVIGPKGSMKSPALSDGTKNLRRIQREFVVEDGDSLLNWKESSSELFMKKKAYEDECRTILKKTGSRADLPPKPEELLNEPPKPERRRIVVNDITLEKLVDLMRKSRGLTMVHDELAGFLLNMSRYHDGSDRQFYLVTHSGGGYNLDRIARGEQYVKDLYLNIIGCIQPSVAKKIFGEDDGDDGFFERFGLLAYPDKQKKFNLVDEYPDKEVNETLRNTFDILIGTEWRGVLQQDEFDDHPFVRLKDNAQDVFNSWMVSHMEELNELGDDLLAGFRAKERGLLVRLVLVMHLTEWAERESEIDAKRVSSVTLENGIEILKKYFEPMWQRVVVAFGMSAFDSKVQRVAAWITDKKVKELTIRKIKRKKWEGLQTNDEVEDVISELIKKRWVGPLKTEKTKGRPRQYYPVNPLIWKKMRPHI